MNDDEIVYERQVHLAAQYMDAVNPDWYMQVDTEILDMQNQDACICGQNGLDWGEHCDPFYEQHGYGAAVFSSRKLEPLWVAEIEKRLTPVYAGAFA